ncbi:MAG: hypothetical protein EAX96_03840 [Candidatus Lokiarchaeota archaeon]|nr:hypothetical protein [Candidatus Lokiarchaeota archaeon]
MDRSINDAIILEKLNNFISIPDNITRIPDLLNLNLTYIRGISINLAEKLKKILRVSTIGELGNKFISKEELNILKALGIKPYQISNWVFIAKMIKEAKFDDFLGLQKISILGLDNAGKTALLNVLQGNTNLELIRNLSPTLGANRIVFTKLDTEYHIWDMGGQEKYRLDYIKNAEKYFINVCLAIYVIDIQDPNKYDKSLTYLKDILRVFGILNERPEFLIILSKVDPDIRNSSEIKANIDSLKIMINEVFKDEKFSHETIIYSVYNWIGASKGIYKEVKDFLTITPKEERQTVQFLSLTVEKILKMIIELSASLEKRLINLEESIQDLQNWIQTTGLIVKDAPKITERKPVEKLDIMKDMKPLISGLRDDFKTLLKIRSNPDED